MSKNLSPEILDRLPPQDLDAERSVLGSILLAPAVIADVARILQPSDFYAEPNAIIYRHLLALDDSAKIDVRLLLDRLATAGDFETIGGEAYVGEVIHAVPHALHADHYAKIVKAKSAARAVIHAGTELLRGGYDQSSTPEEMLATAEATLSGVETGTTQRDLVTAADASVEALRHIQATIERGNAAGALTGLYPYDSMMGGLFPGELVVVGARPGVGKTSLACQIAYHFATHGRGVYFATLEMSAAELILRVLCGVAGISAQDVRVGNCEAKQFGRLTEATGALIDAPWRFDDRPGLSAADIRRACHRCGRKQDLDLVVIDYLQRVRPIDRRKDRREQVAEQARDFKELARELGTPVLLLAQLNRSSERENRSPRLSDLKEAGEIEQEADVVLFPWVQPTTSEQEKIDRADPRNPVPVQLIVAKNRNGSTPKIDLDWIPAATRFEERGGASTWDDSRPLTAATGGNGDFAGYE